MPKQPPEYIKLHSTAAMAALSITWGLVVLSTAVLHTAFGYGEGFLRVLESVYPGYEARPGRIFIGTLWALADGALVGWLISWTYNYFRIKWDDSEPKPKKKPAKTRPKKKRR